MQELTPTFSAWRVLHAGTREIVDAIVAPEHRGPSPSLAQGLKKWKGAHYWPSKDHGHLILIRESFRIDKNDMVVNRVRRLLQIRSLITISLFTTAFIISFWWPLVGFTIICCCLLLYLRPEAPPV